MFKVIVVATYRPAPTLYSASTLSFARMLCSPQYGETCYIYDENDKLIETHEPKEY